MQSTATRYNPSIRKQITHQSQPTRRHGHLPLRYRQSTIDSRHRYSQARRTTVCETQTRGHLARILMFCKISLPTR